MHMVTIISAGKTSILKFIFDIDLLEAIVIGTKCINIIEYNPNVENNP